MIIISYADAGMHTPMLRMVHSVTAINSATPLLLNARNSSNTMPMYPSANTTDMATFWEFQHHRVRNLSIPGPNLTAIIVIN